MVDTNAWVRILGGLVVTAGLAGAAGCQSSYSGAVPDDGVVRAPRGTANDWRLTVVPRSFGFHETPNGNDNALLMVDTSAEPRPDGKSWAVNARALFRYRLEDDGQWARIPADYVLVKK